MTSTHDQQKLLYWIAAGLAGVLVFMLLRSQFDLHSGAPISESRDTAVEMNRALLQQLNIETDTLALVPFRQLRSGLYFSLLDSLGDDTPPVEQLNQENFHLHGWDVVASGKLRVDESFSLSASALFNSGGFYRTQFDNSGQIKQFLPNSDKDAAPFLVGTMADGIHERLVSEIFGYDLTIYELDSEVTSERNDFERGTFELEHETTQVIPDGEYYTFTWKKRAPDRGYSRYIELELQPAVQQAFTDDGYREIAGVNLHKFKAYHELEELPSRSLADHFVAVFFFGVALTTLLVFIEGFSHLFRGKADWFRVLIVAIVIVLGIFGWRLIFFMNFSGVMVTQGTFIVLFNQLVFGVVMGIFGGLAYMGWEANARVEKKFQIKLVDALWRGRLYLKETGFAIIKGISTGAVILGLAAATLVFLNLFLVQADSQFGYTEPMNKPNWLSINISVFITAALVSIGIVGIATNIALKWISNRTVALAIAILVTGLILTGLGRSYVTNGTMVQEMIMFITIAVPLVLVYHFAGIVSVFAGWWFFTGFISILPYIGSPSIEVAMVGWLFYSIVFTLLVFGFIAYKYAPSLNTVDKYIPEYERKMMRSLRFENEMQIARESQARLLPVEAPALKGLDLHGYFVPSMEVGGDYFDYISAVDAEGRQILKLAVVDVSGKSMRAAMHAVFTSGLLRSRMYTDEPAHILQEISPVINEKTDSQTFITCILASYDPVNRKMQIANAGHCRPILKRNGNTEFLETPEPRYPLGMRKTVAYKQMSVDLQPDDLVLFYSDGFPEAVNTEGKRFGFDEALDFIKDLDTDKMTAEQVTLAVKKCVEEFSNHKLADDTTIVCLKIL